MAEAKTKPTGASVEAFLKKAAGDRKSDCDAIAAMMAKASKAPAKMWGPSIVGFGSYDLVSGKTVNAWPVVGFSPRTGDIVIYIAPSLLEDEARLRKIGRHRHGKSCFYIKSLADVDTKELGKLIADSVAHVQKKYAGK
jgi:hypothetical protein